MAVGPYSDEQATVKARTSLEKQGLKPISDAGAIEKLVDEVLAANAKQVDDYRAPIWPGARTDVATWYNNG